MPRIIAVGLGPAGPEHLSEAVVSRVASASTARLRTRRHPAAAAFPDVETFDDLYESAEDFDSLYAAIADELVALARADPTGTVVYAVPGSPLVAERTVALLRARDDVELVVEPAVSFVDLACAALGIDPVAVGLRLADALDLPERLRGPGPLLIAQAHSREVLGDLALRVDVDLADGAGATRWCCTTSACPTSASCAARLDELGSFDGADHLTSVYLPALRTSGDATEDLVDLMARLRAECPWDRVQTHGSLARYLLEESYEALDAIEALARALDDEAVTPRPRRRATLGRRRRRPCRRGARRPALPGRVPRAPRCRGGTVRPARGRRRRCARSSSAATRTSSPTRSPTTPDAVAARWEVLKRAEKGRDSVMDGIPDALPALSLMAKVRRKSLAVGRDDARARVAARGAARRARAAPRARPASRRRVDRRRPRGQRGDRRRRSRRCATSRG